MRWTWISLAALAACAAALACDSTTGPESPRVPAIWTDRPSYVVESTADGWRADIPYVFTNRTGRPVQLEHCNLNLTLRLDQWQRDHWVPAWYPVVPACRSAPVEIGPDETLQDTVHFIAAHPWSSIHPGLLVDGLDGAYRIVWLGVRYTAEAGGGELPREYRSSNVFTLSD